MGCAGVEEERQCSRLVHMDWTRMHTDRLGRPRGGERLRPVSGMRGEGGGVVPRAAGASGALVIVLEASGCGRLLLRALHLTTFSGSGIQFLVILCIPSIKEGSELMDREFATKVSRKDGRKSYLAVAWEVEVLAIIDTRAAERSHCLMDSGHQPRQGRKTPLYGVEKGHRHQEPVAKNHKVGKLHARFRSPHSPVTDLIV